MNKTFSILTLLIAISLNTYSQKNGVELLCSPRKDSILLRWAPTSPEVWRLGNQYGYVVKRFTVLQNKKIPKDIVGTALTEQALKPAPISVWEKYADEKYPAIAAECIYGSELKDISTGGNPQLVYKKYQEEKHRYSFAIFACDQSLTVAKLSGLYLADKTVRQDEKYLYRVYINCPDSLAVDTGYVFTGISEYQPLPKPVGLEAKWGDKEVTLYWNKRYMKHVYNSYSIEKSIDKGKTYQSISDNASVQLSDAGVDPELMYKKDSLPDNETTIYYRIRGISSFGETGPPSDSIFGKGNLPLKNAPAITSNDVVNNKEIVLKWEYPEEMNPYIEGFRIYRSESPRKKKTLIYNGSDSEERLYTDINPAMTNYYLISAYNKANEKISPTISYVALVDSFPPVPPQVIRGKIDTNGIVSLSWLANKESDIEGYRIYTANNPKFEFALVNPSVCSDTVYKDSINLKTLTKNIYYKVKAVDVRQNHSEFSELLSLERPDIIPPVSPVLKSIKLQNGVPEIEWVNSSSTDVVYHHIYRKIKTDSSYQRIETLEKSTNKISVYVDKKAESGNEYFYYLVAEDNSGLVSPPSNPNGIKLPSTFKESIKLKKREFTDRVTLTWSVKSDKKTERIIVYRSRNEAPMKLHGNSTSESFTDEKLSPEKTYHYTIKAIYSDGTSSALSNTVNVKM